jgi:hypothetical protein
MTDTHWHTTPATDLESAIAEFKAALPGWWFSLGECQVSCDASCGPTRESPHIYLIPYDHQFNEGFHADLPQPSTLATALRTVLADAQAAIAALEGKVP